MVNKTKKHNGTINKTEADVIVLGVGTAGEDLSLQLLDAGLDVIGIEPNLVGGECPYWACLPSKIMIRAAKAVKEAHRADKLAGDAQIKLDWVPVAEKVRWMTGSWDDSIAVKRYADRGGTLIKGRGKITGPRTVSVGGKNYTARRGIVIATGSKPFIPPIKGLENVDYWTTHDVIAMEEVPDSMIVIGGGTSGCELGQVAAQFGADVTIVEAADHLLSREEPEVSEVIEEAFEAEGMKIHTGKKAERVESGDGAIVVELSDGEKLTAEKLFIATGRMIDLSDIGLENIGLDSSAAHIEVDEHLRVADGIWAIGDVTGKALLSLVAVYHSNIVAADILNGDAPAVHHDAVPRVTFTDPEVGSVGMTEAQAKTEGQDILVLKKSLPYTFAGVVHSLERGLIKLILDRETETLIGASVVGQQAGNIFGMLNLAVHAKIPLEKLQSMMYGFPALYSAIGEAIGAYGRGVITVVDPEYEGVEKLNELVEV
jgi:pyruvate/2-oxoglutarate dehydrogenase complex dihydrolipoamide dehydrogenase (E3) component